MLQPDTDELRAARETAPEEKARQALAMMADGFALKRSQLRARRPGAAPDEIERLFRAWLEEER